MISWSRVHRQRLTGDRPVAGSEYRADVPAGVLQVAVDRLGSARVADVAGRDGKVRSAAGHPGDDVGLRGVEIARRRAATLTPVADDGEPVSRRRAECRRGDCGAQQVDIRAGRRAGGALDPVAVGAAGQTAQPRFPLVAVGGGGARAGRVRDRVALPAGRGGRRLCRAAAAAAHQPVPQPDLDDRRGRREVHLDGGTGPVGQVGRSGQVTRIRACRGRPDGRGDEADPGTGS